MINIDSRSSKPIYEQIIDSIKENIMKGILVAGDKLPSVRELSSMVTVNPNTVAKAYQELERQKVIETLRGRGTFVSSNYKPQIQEDKLMMLKEDAKKIVVEAHYMGINKENLINIIKDIYDELERE